MGLKKVNSEQLFKEAENYFPGGVNSPVRAFRSVGGTPIFITEGNGCRIKDADGNEYIDFCGSWGPLILGHAHPAITEAVCETARRGTGFGAPTQYENTLAKIILDNHPSIQKLRFVSSGTEAVMSAIRLARGYTGKNKVVKFEGCYHGHADSMMVKAGSGLSTFSISTSAGITPDTVSHTIVLPLNDIEIVSETLARSGNDIACIIIEPVPANNGLLIQDRSYLQRLRELTHKHNVLLIFDEVISGFRIGFRGASGYYGIKPDIITFGKIIGGGLPVGAYGASEEIMNQISPVGPVYQAGTLSGNPVAMAAGIAALTECLKPGFYEKLDGKTAKFAAVINEYCRSNDLKAQVVHLSSIFWISFGKDSHARSASDIMPDSMQAFNKMYHYLLSRGIYLGPSGYEVGFISEAHRDDDLEKSANVICAAISHALSDAVFEKDSHR